MGIEVIDKPDLDETGTDGPSVAHIIMKRDEMEGYFFGKPVRALCGEWFVPTRDPNQFPLCDPCKAALAEIYQSGEPT